MDLAPDFNEFIASLNAQGVECLIVGAYALAFHGAPRFTGDLGILVRPTSDNAAKVLVAVRAFGFPVDTLTSTDLIDPRRSLEMLAVRLARTSLSQDLHIAGANSRQRPPSL